MLERTSPFQIVTNKMKKNSGRKWMEKEIKEEKWPDLLCTIPTE